MSDTSTKPERHAAEAPEDAPKASPAPSDENGGVLYPVKVFDIRSGSPEVFIHPDQARELSVHPLDRVRVVSAKSKKDAPALVNVSTGLVVTGVIGISVELAVRLGADTADKVRVYHAPRPRSVEFVKAKLDGRRLSEEEVHAIIADIADGNLTSIEVTAWASALHVHGMDLDETVACVRAMVDTGERIHFSRGPVVDVHSIGGVPGNKYAPLAVPIVAANGLLIPKTSSRAISSACGTADFMEVVTPVALTAEQVRSITEKVGGTLAWGGGVNLAPADDEIIRVEYPLSLDPPSQLLASVLSKKLAVGATKVLIDIPTGVGAKVRDSAAARRLARDFIAVGDRVGLDIQVLISQGDRPVGTTIGPILEIQEALRVLEGADEPADLIDKACTLSGRLLEMGGMADAGSGYDKARETLRSGAALEKFHEILKAQGAERRTRADDLSPGTFTREMRAPRDGPVVAVDIKALVRIARAAGAPQIKGAGLKFHVRPGMNVGVDQPLYTIHAEHASRLEEAVHLARQLRPYQIAGGDVYGFVE